MRILTWNINGVRTLPQYHPWNTFKAFDDILNHIQADIICFQEMKSSRKTLPQSVALPPSYSGFFSFPIRKSGYSGVVTYVKNSIVPIKAEEGLSGVLQPKPPLNEEERISSMEGYPQRVISDEDEGKEGAVELDYKDLDNEGRAVLVDFGLFVLINVYCPNDGNGTEERDRYKADFHRVLEARVRGLVEREGREVIVVGDLNACASVADHCEGPLMVARGKAEGMLDDEGFWEKDVRRWLRDWILNSDGTGGYMVDIVRRLWPDRKGMYTCWNTKISARESNYGTRIDYILITQGLLPWVKGGNIQPTIKGSDHCPVYLDLHDSITDANGNLINLQDAMGSTVSRELPRLASKYWEENLRKQMLLQNFFAQKGNNPLSTDKPPVSILLSREDTGSPLENIPQSPPFIQHPVSTPLSASSSCSEVNDDTLVSSNSTINQIVSMSSGTRVVSPPPQEESPESSEPISVNTSTEVAISGPIKRKLTADTLARNITSSKKPKQEKGVGQTKLSTFFAKPKASTSSSSQIAVSSKRQSRPREAEVPPEEEIIDVDIEADYQFAISLSQESDSSQRPEVDGAETKTKQAWTNLLAPIQPPKCVVHGEVAKEFTVGKPGPNKGKKFFICARPVGPGYDKGRTERLREHVDRRWRCDFFKWSSDVRREMRKGNS